MMRGAGFSRGGGGGGGRGGRERGKRIPDPHRLKCARAVVGPELRGILMLCEPLIHLYDSHKRPCSEPSPQFPPSC